MQQYAHTALLMFGIIFVITLYSIYCTIELIMYRKQCKKDASLKRKMRLNLFKYIFGINRLANSGQGKLFRLFKRAHRATKCAFIVTIIAGVLSIAMYGRVWVYQNLANQYGAISYYSTAVLANKNKNKNVDNGEGKDDNRHDMTEESSEGLGDTAYSIDGTAIIPKSLANFSEYKEAIEKIQKGTQEETETDETETENSEETNNTEENTNTTPEITEREILTHIDLYNTVIDALSNYYSQHENDTADKELAEKVQKEPESYSYEDFIKADPKTYLDPYLIIALNKSAEKNKITSVGLMLSDPEKYGIASALKEAGATQEDTTENSTEENNTSNNDTNDNDED